jgi:hypothetical protein
MNLIRLVVTALLRRSVQEQEPENCWPYHPGHPEGIHYHWGWGSRRTTLSRKEALSSPYGTDKPFVTRRPEGS